MKLLSIIGAFFVFGSCILLQTKYQDYHIEKNGVVVKMKLIHIPTSCIGAKVPYFIKFEYNGDVYDKKVRGDFCEKHHVGEIFDIKMLEGQDHILWPDESLIIDMLGSVALGIVGLFFMIYQWRKK